MKKDDMYQLLLKSVKAGTITAVREAAFVKQPIPPALICRGSGKTGHPEIGAWRPVHFMKL